MVYRYKTFRDNKGIVVLQSLKVSQLSINSNRFYASPKLKNWMCELCTLSQSGHIFVLALIIILYSPCTLVTKAINLMWKPNTVT